MSDVELADTLKGLGIVLPEGMSKEIKTKIYTALDDVIREGDEKDYNAFIGPLKRGTANPDLLYPIVSNIFAK